LEILQELSFIHASSSATVNRTKTLELTAEVNGDAVAELNQIGGFVSTKEADKKTKLAQCQSHFLNSL